LLAGSSAARVDQAGVRAKQTDRAIAVLGPRVAGSANELRAGRVVRARFARLGLTPVVQGVPLPRGGFSRNLVFRTGGGPLRAIVVAHLDGVSAGFAANDNGSGVGALVEVARELGKTPGVLYAALGAEEQVMTGSSLHLGSARLLRSLTRAERRSVRVALSLDMVGWGPELNVRGIEVRGPNRSARAALAAARSIGVRVTYLPDRGLSDHEELTRGGVPAAWIEWRWDPCWHSACDRVGRLETAKLSAVIRLTVRAVRTATR
ncbi:MAG TPA: M28 family peptidase, partial [Gaiellaceae bacterium]|nr:M28 family peptidase [Gaiellaceae bacterium]